MRKLPTLVALLAGALVLTVLLHPVRTVRAQSGCTVNSLSGPFAYLLSGFTYDSNGYQVDLAASGLLMADGAGNVTGGDTLSDDGTIVRRTYTGTYTINADCTGSAAVTYSGSGKSSFDLVVLNNGKDANMIETDAGVIFSGSARQQFPNP